ncbi:hypothetical protein [Mesorhizobium sp. KR9-304]|uniref:hypothetical protein n=1 Tax=Mesorhizobium sp. KR9-304 TaxID=3156614 RepID=UPI0032B35A7B
MEQMKSFLMLAATAALGFVAVSASTAPAAAAGCYYKLYQDGVGLVTGKLAIQGYATAIKMENACDRARRECNRRLDRARKRGDVPRAEPRELRCQRRPT